MNLSAKTGQQIYKDIINTLTKIKLHILEFGIYEDDPILQKKLKEADRELKVDGKQGNPS
ncbi:MAG: hypothetical protein PHX21_05895 [bacterium]|nr:hypothetical protein [bacterium]